MISLLASIPSPSSGDVEIGPVALHAYGLMLLLGIAAATWLTGVRWVRRIALRKAEQPQDVTIGVLCDASRFANVEDPVEWDVFRSGIHESQGWTLLRVWSPQFFRDPKGTFRTIVDQAQNG